MNVRPEIFADPTALAAGVAAHLVAAVAARRGPFYLALSGGSTPAALFSHLAEHHRDAVDWSRLWILWGDERCVPPDAEASNYHMAHAALLRHVPIPPGQVLRMHGELPPPAGAAAYAAVLREQFAAEGRPPRLDLALQGVGTDGHTASLFPHHAALTAADLVAPVHVPDVEPPWRLTLTLPLLANARAVWFLASGAAKAAVLARIWADPAAAAEVAPAARLHCEARAPRWFVDRAAAGR